MKNTETAIDVGLAKHRITARNVKLQIAIAEFQINGGEWGVAYALLCAAYGRGGEGRSAGAGEAIQVMPDTSPTDAAEGHPRLADKATTIAPDAATSRHKPGHARRGAAAIASVQATVAKSLFDSTFLPDGRRLREVRWSECPGLSTKYRRLSRIFMAIHNVAVPADPNTTLDNVVSDDKLIEIVSAVEMVNDIH